MFEEVPSVVQENFKVLSRMFNTVLFCTDLIAATRAEGGLVFKHPVGVRFNHLSNTVYVSKLNHLKLLINFRCSPPSYFSILIIMTTIRNKFVSPLINLQSKMYGLE